MAQLYGYNILLQKFMSNGMSAENFVSAFTDKFLGDQDPIGDDVFEPLDELFVFVEGFTRDQTLLNKKNLFLF